MASSLAVGVQSARSSKHRAFGSATWRIVNRAAGSGPTPDDRTSDHRLVHTTLPSRAEIVRKLEGCFRDLTYARHHAGANRWTTWYGRPFLGGPARGKCNERASTVHTAEVITGLQGVDVAEVARATRATAERLFGGSTSA